jgi:dUTP pyrophosphatase
MMDTNDFDYLLNDMEDDISNERLKEMMENLGVDLDEMERKFADFHPRRELRYEKISEDAVDPKYNYPSDSGFDLYSTQDLEIGPFGRILVPTGLKFDIPDGTEIQVRPKSGLAIKQGLTVLNTPGTVDSGYNGEVQVIVFNTNNHSVTIPKGMKVAQAVLCPVVNGDWVELINVKSVDEKDRGDNGFGSTGIFDILK